MGLFRSGIVVALYIFLSRVFGLARELFVAYIFGAGMQADCVNIAFKLPNLFRRIFAEGALATVFIPIFNEKLVHSKNDAEKFAGEIFNWLLFALITLTLILEIFMPQVMYVFAPGFHHEPEKFNLAILLCRVTLPYLIFISLASHLGSMLNSIGHFAAFAFVPVILNIVIIIGTLLFQKFISFPEALAYSILLGGLMQLIFMTVALKGSKLQLPFMINRPTHDTKKFMQRMGPAALSTGIMQLNLFITQSFASFVPGAISILSYADRLYQFPLSIIGVTFSTILLPSLSKANKLKDVQQISILQTNAVKLALLFSLPATCGIIALAHPIIHIIYQHGHFTQNDTIHTANALSAYALGLPAFILIRIISTIYYSNQNLKTPLAITTYSLIISTVLTALLITKFTYMGVALSTSISTWMGLLLIYLKAKQHGYLILDKSLKIFILKLILACLLMLCIIMLFLSSNEHLFYHTNIAIKSTILGILILLAGGIFLGTNYLLGNFKQFLNK